MLYLIFALVHIWGTFALTFWGTFVYSFIEGLLMHIIARSTIAKYSKKNAYAKNALDDWYFFTKKAQWKNGIDVTRDYPLASLLGNNRYVFNIKGNHYRLIVDIDFLVETIYIRFIGTHSEYSKINAKEV